MKVLICTFGKDDNTIFAGLRIHRYDKLILILEEEAKRSAQYNNVLELEKYNTLRPETVIIDPENFMECYKKIENAIDRHKSDNIILNISGGTKLLSMASILCAFNRGIPAVYYGEEGLVNLPVFKNITIAEKISPGQQKVLVNIEDGIQLDKLKQTIFSSEKLHLRAEQDFDRLLKLDIARIEKEQDEFRIRLTPVGNILKDHFEAVGTK